MIFILDGGIENLLALTPVIAEWRRRNGDSVFVETLFPEVFALNPYVDGAGRSMGRDSMFYDLNLLPWSKVARCVTELYAERVFGDVAMQSWRTIMVHSKEDEAKARQMVSGGKVAAVCLDPVEISAEMAGKVVEAVRGKGYEVVDVSRGKCFSLGVQRAAISMAEVFIGSDGPASCVALTTDVPAVVCHTWRNPVYFQPFRRGVPYEAVGPSDDDCSVSKICIMKNGFAEFGKTYWHDCTEEKRFVCRQLPFDQMVSDAVDRVAARA